MKKHLNYFKKALDICKQIGWVEGQAVSLGDIGQVYSSMGDAEQALKHYKGALERDVQIGNLRGQASNLGAIGRVYNDMGGSSRALMNHFFYMASREFPCYEMPWSY